MTPPSTLRLLSQVGGSAKLRSKRLSSGCVDARHAACGLEGHRAITKAKSLWNRKRVQKFEQLKQASTHHKILLIRKFVRE